jgi:hypothetical protein
MGRSSHLPSAKAPRFELRGALPAADTRANLAAPQGRMRAMIARGRAQNLKSPCETESQLCHCHLVQRIFKMRA